MMARAVMVRMLPTETKITVEIPPPVIQKQQQQQQQGNSNGNSKSRTLVKIRTEPIEKTFSRLALELERSTAPPGGSKKKNKKQADGAAAAPATEEDPSPSAASASSASSAPRRNSVPAASSYMLTLLDASGKEVDMSTTHEQAWQHGGFLVMDGDKVPIVVNIPRITSLSLPSAMVGTPLQAVYATESASRVTWRWVAVMPGDGGAEEEIPSSTNDPSIVTPTQQHVGATIRVECTPWFDDADVVQQGEGGGGGGSSSNSSRQGITATAQIAAPVAAEPEMRHVQLRTSAFAPSTAPPPETIRIASYNILHDGCATGDYSETVLYPFCPPKFLALSYREHLLLREVRLLASDVVCMQEVGASHFSSFWRPQLSLCGMDGCMKAKGGAGEGEAVFWRRDRFECRGEHGIDMREAILLPRNADIRVLAEASPHVIEAFMKSSVTLQVVDLFDKVASRRLLVANTHLFYHPGAPHLRATHAMFITRMLEDLLVTSEDRSKVGVVVCGDMNCSQRSSVMDLFTAGEVAETHSCWKIGSSFVWKQSKEAFWNKKGPREEKAKVSGAVIRVCDVPTSNGNVREQEEIPTYAPRCVSSLPLRNVCAELEDQIPFTHIMGHECRACVLDHILYQSSSMQLVRAMPTLIDPTEAATLLPSEGIGSDHLSIAAEFTWK